VFPNVADADRVIQQLVASGFARDAIVLVTNDNPNRHEILGEETSDVTRGFATGTTVAGIGGMVGGMVLSSFFGASVWTGAAVGAAIGALAGAVLGSLIGSGTSHQVQEEYEHLLDSGAVVIAVDTDREHAHRAQRILHAGGGSALSRSVHRRHRASQRTA
jgi:outer membrane lipoprotein SlyB